MMLSTHHSITIVPIQIKIKSVQVMVYITQIRLFFSEFEVFSILQCSPLQHGLLFYPWLTKSAFSQLLRGHSMPVHPTFSPAVLHSCVLPSRPITICWETCKSRHMLSGEGDLGHVWFTSGPRPAAWARFSTNPLKLYGLPEQQEGSLMVDLVELGRLVSLVITPSPMQWALLIRAGCSYSFQ